MPKPTYQELIEQKVRYDTILQSIGEGLLVILDVDKGGKVAFVNMAFEKITGWKSEEVLGKSVSNILTRMDEEGNVIPFKEGIMTKILSGEAVTADLTQPFYYQRKDKSKFPVASIITPIISDGKIVGAVEAFRDISKEKEADKAKTEFASLVSHQLRTPFSTINWYVELLLSEDVGSLNENQIQYLQEVYKASKRMVDLINVLLSVSRIKMGITEYEKELVDVVDVAETIVNEEKQYIKEKNLEFEKIYDKDIPKIQADPEQISIILQNLLSNAIRYTLEGDKVSLKIKHQDNNITIAVADTGIGIPKAAQEKIFDKFFRGDNAKEQDPKGIGLGLYITKEVVEMLNGEIWFKSQEDKGTTFYVTLPVNNKRKTEATEEKQNEPSN